MKIYVFVIIMIAVLLLSGCTQPKPTLETNATEQDVSNLVDANNKFAFDKFNYYQNKGEENLFLSPYSISNAMGMVYEGANGQTKYEIQSVFHYPKNSDQATAYMYNLLNSNSKEYQLNTANALWIKDDFDIKQNYIETIQDYYGGEITKLDFNQAEQSRQTINSWVELQTNDKIKDLLPQGSINGLNRVILTNAIYFKGEWVKEFDKCATKERPFYLADNKNIMIDTMYQKNGFEYMENNNVQVLQMDYKGNDLSMMIILPKINNQQTIDNLSYGQIKSWRSQLYENEVKVYMPKFKLENKYSMKNALIEMGMPTTFTEDADLTSIAKDLYISSIIHQTYIEVDEKGTEAAAATGITLSTSAAAPGNGIIFNANHPFVYIIQENNTGEILFIGKMDNPK